MISRRFPDLLNLLNPGFHSVFAPQVFRTHDRVMQEAWHLSYILSSIVICLRDAVNVL